MRIYSEKDIARFWAKVAVGDPRECWDWTAYRDRKGYGHIKFMQPKRHSALAHVVSYELAKGPTNGLFVCHACDRPSCCNPNHLWLGTNGENQRDSYQKQRRLPLPTAGEANGYAKLTAKDVAVIRELLATHTNIVLGEKYGVHHATISLIRRGKTWLSLKP